MFKVGDKVVVDNNSEEWKKNLDFDWAEEMEQEQPLVISEIRERWSGHGKTILSFSNSMYSAEESWVKLAE